VRLAALAALLVAAVAAALTACSKDPAREEARRVERDQVQLNEIALADGKAEHALHDVGEAEKAGKDDEAASLIEGSVLPATDQAIVLTRGKTLESSWGRERQADMLAAMTARREELPRYVVALRAHDMELELASVQKQLDIERRAMAAAQAIADGPSALDGGAKTP
jgi:hypothetical protein